MLCLSLAGLAACSTTNKTQLTKSHDENCRPIVVLTGYWPPTNEMLRPWSTSRTANPTGWQGRNWRELGFDIYAFFPEFPPDGDPTNDPIGSPGSTGAVDADFQVDYQDTSQDFWRIMDLWQPDILITTSRGGKIGWELEALEGGHATWAADRYGVHHQPEQDTIDPRSWAAISDHGPGNTLASQLPLRQIATATRALNLTDVVIDQHTSGNYLSGFMGLHGLYYNRITDNNIAAGHIHVGKGLAVTDALSLMRSTLETVLYYHAGARRGSVCIKAN